MKFNMGCGAKRLPGFVNVDAAPAAEPDEVVDLETTPWPWPDNCAEEIRFIHSLEHMGQDPKVFLAIMQEIYRIAAPDCRVVIHVPHPRHENYLSDPTHVRPITPQTLALFDRRKNEKAQAQRLSNTPLAIYTGVDFVTEQMKMRLDEPYASQLDSGELTPDAIGALMRSHNNVVKEIQFELRVRKPAYAG